jgi:hypothetical protein
MRFLRRPTSTTLKIISALGSNEQGSTAFASTSLVLPIEIRESVTATRLAGKFNTTGIPAVLAAADNPSLADDYIKLAHYIHTHPL